MNDTLVDRIYEAAFVPEFWPSVLGEIADRANAASGELQIVVNGEAPRWKATEVTHETLSTFMESGLWRSCERPGRYLQADHAGFLCDVDIMTHEQFERDPVRHLFSSVGLGWQLGTVIPMTTGEIIGLTFERWIERGKPSAKDRAALDALRPHLARSALVAARLRLERAEAAVSALDAMGVPAAVISGSGRVLTANRFFDAMGHVFLPLAFGGVAITDSSANRLFQDAMMAMKGADWSSVRSIPLAPASDRAAAIVHVLPLRHAAHDIFSGADILVIANELKPEATAPTARILSALFDLTPSEARVAGGLAEGKSLKRISAEMGIGFGSGRTYLARIFNKTGTNQQSQLVALLKSTQPLPLRDNDDRPAH